MRPSTPLPRAALACLALAQLSVCHAAPAQHTPVPIPANSSQKMPASHAAPAPAAKNEPLDAELLAAIKTAPAATKWPNENSMELLDLGDVTVKSDGTVVTRYRKVIKLFNENARGLAEVSFSYNNTYQSIKVLHARTIQTGGQVKTVAPSEIRTTSPYSEYALYDDSKNVGFSLPGIEDNCVIDYEWEITTRPMLLPGHFWDNWIFTGSVPVTKSRYTLTVPAAKAFHFKVYNDAQWKPRVTEATQGDRKTVTWELNDIAPRHDETGMPAYNKLNTWLEVTSLNSWQEYAAWYWKLQHPRVMADDAIRARVKELTAGKTTDEAKARAIYDWVANHVRYVGLEFGLDAYQPHSAALVNDKLYGDCKDKATLLITMLDLAGIKASPVLLDTDDTRKLREFLPALDWFDHCIAVAQINGKEVWLDATAESCAYGDIPDSDRGSDAFVIRDNTGTFETIPEYKPEENGSVYRLHITPASADTVNMDVELILRGTGAQGLRGQLRSLTPEMRDKVKQGFARAFGREAKLKECVLPEPFDKSDPVVVKVALNAASHFKKVGDFLLTPASFMSAVSTSRFENPFTDETRKLPIVVSTATQWELQVDMALPDGYEVEALPADVDLSCALYAYHRRAKKSPDGKSLLLTETVVSNIGEVPPTDYALVKTYYDKVARAYQDEIILKRH